MLGLAFNNKTKNKGYLEFFFKKIIDKAISVLGLKFETIELSVNLVGKNEMTRLNHKYRNKNKPTDVLSFPLNDRVDYKLKKNAILALGDIFICLPIAEERARKEGNSPKSELEFLTIHGFLHLLGHDHEKSAKEARRMAELEQKILKNIK